MAVPRGHEIGFGQQSRRNRELNGPEQTLCYGEFLNGAGVLPRGGDIMVGLEGDGKIALGVRLAYSSL